MIRQRVFEEIYQSMRNNIDDRDETIDSKPGTFISDVFVCPTADELAAFYSDLKRMEINQSVLTAAGDDLDRLGKNYFTTRIGATKASGKVRFYIAGTNQVNIDVDRLPTEIYVPVGFIVGTTETSTVNQVQFVTTESASATASDVVHLLPVDTSTGYRYLEVYVEAVKVGAEGNVDAGGVDQLVSANITGIISIHNPMAMTGGADQENDASLRMRIMLAILGASICTKNGYLKHVIVQDYVDDAIVVGGGDEIMFRDGGFLNSAGKYVYGRGGMVDIWVRGRHANEATQTFPITTTYLEKGAQDVVLDFQPTLKIVSIRSLASGVVFENADLYEIEYSASATASTYRYYKDILWDFSVTDTFPDTAMYPVDIIDPTELELMKRRVDAELANAVDYLLNVDQTINWALVTYEDISRYEVAPLFQKVYYNGRPYKIIAVDARLNGRTFVKRNNRIYLRWYKQPDYVLLKTTYSDERYVSQHGNDVGGSVLSKDAVHWINKSILQEGDSMVITYEYNLLTIGLQQRINGLRILTADILVRQAIEVPIQIMMTVECDNTTTSTTVRNVIATMITRFVESMKSLGASIEESELVAIARQVSGVTYVDLDSVQLAKQNSIAVPKIQLSQNEYFSLVNIDVTVNAATTLIS